ncbi:dual specificity protein phosphatase 18 [Ascaphus truei]|uniref:dual specificity protein phosphatase 18 n=1 Tax=Ascaphus truei TaxID=8439 RepID=UPI003F595189
MTKRKEAGATPSAKNKSESLSGLTEITSGLYLSNAAAARNRILLTTHRITCVINVSLEKASSVSSDLEYLHIPVADTPDTFLLEYFDAIADKIHNVEAMGGRTLLHCAAGISRSSTLCLAYLMKYNGLSLLDAHTWLKTCRPIIRPNSGFWEQLINYEIKMFRKSTVHMIHTPLGLIPNIYEEETRNMVPF